MGNFIGICSYFGFIFCKTSILVRMVLNVANSLSSSIRKDIKLLFLFLSPSSSLKNLTNPLILGKIKTNGFIALSKYPTKYLELSFVSTDFEKTILSTLTSQIYIVFPHQKIVLLLLYNVREDITILSQHYYIIKKICCRYF